MFNFLNLIDINILYFLKNLTFYQFLFFINLIIFFLSLLFFKSWFKEENDVYSINYTFIHLIYDFFYKTDLNFKDRFYNLIYNKKYIFLLFFIIIFVNILLFFCFILIFFFTLFNLIRFFYLKKNYNFIFILNSKYYSNNYYYNISEFIYLITIKISKCSAYRISYLILFFYKNKLEKKDILKKISLFNCHRLFILFFNFPFWLFNISLDVYNIFIKNKFNIYLVINDVSLNIFNDYNLSINFVGYLKIYKFNNNIYFNPELKFFTLNDYKLFFYNYLINNPNFNIKLCKYIIINSNGVPIYHIGCYLKNYDSNEQRILTLHTHFDKYMEDNILMYKLKNNLSNIVQFINYSNIVKNEDIFDIDFNERIVNNIGINNQEKLNIFCSIFIYLYKNEYPKFCLLNGKKTLLNEQNFINYKINKEEEKFIYNYANFEKFNGLNIFNLVLNNNNFVNQYNFFK